MYASALSDLSAPTVHRLLEQRVGTDLQIVDDDPNVIQADEPILLTTVDCMADPMRIPVTSSVTPRILLLLSSLRRPPSTGGRLAFFAYPKPSTKLERGQNVARNPNCSMRG